MNVLPYRRRLLPFLLAGIMLMGIGAWAVVAAPMGSVVINNDAPATNSIDVTLALTASDTIEMRLSNNGTSYGAWQPFAPVLPWRLTGGQGLKPVYVEFRNALSETVVVSDTILYDVTPPRSSTMSPATVYSSVFVVSWSGSDDGSGVVSYDVQYNLNDTGWQNWIGGTMALSATFGPTVPFQPRGGDSINFRTRARDAAGNMSIYPATGHTQTVVVLATSVYAPLITRVPQPEP